MKVFALALLAAAVLPACTQQPELVALEEWQSCSVPVSPDNRCPKGKAIRKPDVVRVVEHLIVDKKKAQALQPTVTGAQVAPAAASGSAAQTPAR